MLNVTGPPDTQLPVLLNVPLISPPSTCLWLLLSWISPHTPFFLIGDHAFGDTGCLWSPPPVSKCYLRNSNVTALGPTVLERVILYLMSEQSVSSETFWSCFDHCSCGRWFAKVTLHFIHGPKCPSGIIPALLSPLQIFPKKFLSSLSISLLFLYNTAL